jgi:hypothetical protein
MIVTHAMNIQAAAFTKKKPWKIPTWIDGKMSAIEAVMR